MQRVPVFGDEAYFLFWALHPAQGYYDLSPMIAWWLAPFVQSWKWGYGFFLEPLLTRLPNLFTGLSVAYGIYLWFKPFDQKRALISSLLFLLLPVTYLLLLSTPDVPLVFFSFFSAYVFYKADFKFLEGSRKVDFKILLGFFLAGVLWGGAFLSKHLALAITPAIPIWIFLSRDSLKQKIQDLWILGALFLGALPAIMQQWHWNQEHCWANIVFNVVTRQSVSDGPYFELNLYFLLYLVVYALPFGFFIFLKPFAVLTSPQKKLRSYLLLMWLMPMMVFGYTVIIQGKGQGLHWYLSYLPFFVLWVSLKLNELQLKKILYRSLGASLALGVAALYGISLGSFIIENKLNTRHKLDFAIAMEPYTWVTEVLKTEQEWLKPQAQVEGKRLWVTDSYSFSGQLEVALKRYYPKEAQNIEISVWDQGSRFGRVYDWTTSWIQYDAKPVLLIARAEMSPWNWSEFFGATTSKTIFFEKSFYWISQGAPFQAQAFIEKKVKPALERFYPPWKYPARFSARCKIPSLNGDLR